MRNTDRWKAGNRPAAFTVERGCRRRFEPDAIDQPDKRERLTEAFAAEAAEAVEAANAERAAAIGKGQSR